MEHVDKAHLDKAHLEQAKEILYDHLETINEEYEGCGELSDYSLDEMYKTIKTIHYIEEIYHMNKPHIGVAHG